MKTVKPPTARYMEKVYLAWLNQVGQVRSQKEFAEYLELDQIRFNRYYNGARTEIDYATALSICRKTGDYELMDILGYPRPIEGFDFSSLPPEDAASLRAAVFELTDKLNELGDFSDDEYRAVRDEVMEKYGWKRISDNSTASPEGPSK
jgi:hypothetical protein